MSRLTRNNAKRLNDQSYRDALNHVYGLAHNVCINGKEQKFLIAHLQDIEFVMIANGETGDRTIKELLCVIIDGLKFGNWPWIKNGINLLELNKKENSNE